MQLDPRPDRRGSRLHSVMQVRLPTISRQVRQRQIHRDPAQTAGRRRGGALRHAGRQDRITGEAQGARFDLRAARQVVDAAGGNYRCITKDGMRTAKEAVHSNIEESRSVYNFVLDCASSSAPIRTSWCRSRNTLAAAHSLSRPASAARALFNGAPNIERCDKLVQLIAKQKGLSHPVIDANVTLVDELLDKNRKKAAA